VIELLALPAVKWGRLQAALRCSVAHSRGGVRSVCFDDATALGQLQQRGQWLVGGIAVHVEAQTPAGRATGCRWHGRCAARSRAGQGRGAREYRLKQSEMHPSASQFVLRQAARRRT